jgi:hypothetical protein
MARRLRPPAVAGLIARQRAAVHPGGRTIRFPSLGDAVMTIKRILLAAAVLAACYLLMTPSAAVAHPRHDPSVEFDRMDTNHDGKISAKEHADAAARMFKDMDANADGQVTRAEMEAAHDKMMPMPPGKR